MSKTVYFFVITFFLVAHSLIASDTEKNNCKNNPKITDSLALPAALKDSVIVCTDSIASPVSLASSLDSTIQKKTASTKILRKKKIISALCAFPFPLGFVAAHRVMLGTKPWVPVVYVATFGGCFGLLPLIDFCVIIFSKDIEQYENNPNIFMWVK